MNGNKLNKIQKAAVESIDGPILIFAGAGSGKTRVLTHKMYFLINENHYKPEDILAVTFTNKAAKEMKERVMGLLKTDNLPITIGTFHSVFARLLRKEAKYLNISSHFAIYDVQDQLDLLKVILKSLNITKDQVTPNQARNQISYLKKWMAYLHGNLPCRRQPSLRNLLPLLPNLVPPRQLRLLPRLLQS